MKTPKKLLLPLSFGASSACLLHFLDQHLQSQYDRMGRSGYQLYVVHVDIYVEDADRKTTKELLQKYEARYSRHTYFTIGLEEALQLDAIDWAVFDLPERPDPEGQQSDSERLQALISVLKSATSRADIISTLLTRLLVEVAKTYECETILFGNTTTRLAEKTLTETAKGRGFSLPWQVSDGMSPYGIAFNYPLRDVLKKEVVSFSSLLNPSLNDLIVVQDSPTNISASSKMTTIDDLLAQYFESVEDNYPSIVANVVRTTSKLQPASKDDAKCGLCGLPAAPGTDGIFGWGGDQTSVAPLESEPRQHGILCYGCSRSING